jgi:hypothetical protein
VTCLAARLAAIIAVVSTGVVYGTDVFCTNTLRPALAAVDGTTGRPSVTRDAFSLLSLFRHPRKNSSS